VAQRSSLSAFAGNILLFELDHEPNCRDLVAARYIDDLLMVSNTQSELSAAVSVAKQRLQEFYLSLYEPAPGSDKAAGGLCINSIIFLSCSIQPNRCVPSNKSLSKLKIEIASLLSNSKKAITATANTGSPLNPDLA